MKQVPVVWEDILGRVAAHDIVDPQTKEVLVECNQEITQEKLDLIRDKGIHQIDVLFIDESSVGPYLRNTLLQDRIKSPKMRFWKSIVVCVRVIRRRWNRRPISLTIYFLIRTVTTFPKSVVSSSIIA